MKKIISMILAITVVAGTATGCKKEGSSMLDNEAYKTDFSQYKSSDEIPSWEGENLSIIKWVQASNPVSTCNKNYNLNEDPITKEIKRITGIDYNLDESFDNAESSFDAVVAKVISTNSFPHVAEGISDISSLVKNEYLWEIGDYIKEYAPTVYEKFGPESGTLYADLWNNQEKTYGGVYELAIGASTEPMRPLFDAGQIDVDEETFNKVFSPTSAYPSVKVRDDILKKLYPESHSVDELIEIFEKNGKFTEEEIFDIPLESPEDFIVMLERIRDLKLMDGSNEVYATFTHVGMDNWAIMQQMGAMFGHTSSNNPSLSYFSFYDKKAKELKPTFKETWFKDLMREYNRWVREGIASEEALVDANNVFKEKLNNGRYIVTYGSYTPNEAALNGKYKYRPVYAKYKVDTDTALFAGTDYTKYNKYTFFKDSLSEEQLIQLIRMFEFLVSDAGEKLCYWGTKEMGTYTEDENGNLAFIDEAVKNEAILKETYGNKTIAPLGLDSSVWPGRIMNHASKYYPRFTYADELQTWTKAYSSAQYGELETVTSLMPNIYGEAFLNQFEGAKSFWNARNGFENAMLRVFAAGTDEEFEAKFNEMLKYAEDNGLTDELFKEATKWYNEEYNKEYMQYIK